MGADIYGVGFMLGDGYVGIDIDRKDHTKLSAIEEETQHNVWKVFGNSYVEYSPGGNYAVHILLKMDYHGPGRDRGGIGVYGKERYFTFTGQVCGSSSASGPLPQCDTETFNRLISMMPSHGADDYEASVVLTQIDSIEPDDNVIRRGMQAKNSAKFGSLYQGLWQQVQHSDGNVGYPSQSEADMAFMTLLLGLTEDNEQAKRLFAASGLWTEERLKKKRESYIHRTLVKARTRQIRERAQARGMVGEAVANLPMPAMPAPPEDFIPHDGSDSGTSVDGIPTHLHDFPESCVWLKHAAWWAGEVSYQSTHTIRNIAALMIAQLAGARRVATTQQPSPPTMSIIVLAPTGKGKDTIPSAVNELATRTGLGEYIGGEMYASPQALTESLISNPAKIWIADEAGKSLRSLAKDTTPFGMRGVMTLLTKAYAAYNRTLRPIEAMRNSRNKAEYKERNQNCYHPHIGTCFISTPGAFTMALEHEFVEDGTWNRFIPIIINEDEPLQKHAEKVTPAEPRELVTHVLERRGKTLPTINGMPAMGAILVEPENSQEPAELIHLPLSDDSMVYLKERDYERERVVDSKRGQEREFYASITQRMIENTKRLAVCMAYFEGMEIIPLEIVQWCYEFIEFHNTRFWVYGRDSIELMDTSPMEKEVAKLLKATVDYFEKQKGEVLWSQLTRSGGPFRRKNTRFVQEVIQRLKDSGELYEWQENRRGRPTRIFLYGEQKQEL